MIKLMWHCNGHYMQTIGQYTSHAVGLSIAEAGLGAGGPLLCTAHPRLFQIPVGRALINLRRVYEQGEPEWNEMHHQQRLDLKLRCASYTALAMLKLVQLSGARCV